MYYLKYKKQILILGLIICVFSCLIFIFGCSFEERDDNLYSVYFYANDEVYYKSEFYGIDNFDEYHLVEPQKNNHIFNGWFFEDGEAFDNNKLLERLKTNYRVNVYAKFTVISPFVIEDGVLIELTPIVLEMTSLTIPEGVTEIKRISYGLYLEEIILPSTLKKIDANAFWGCGNLKSIELPEGVEYVGDFAFDQCWELKEITLPSTLKEIGIKAFAARNLEVLNYNVKGNLILNKNNNPFYKAGINSNGITLNIGENVEILSDYLFYSLEAVDGKTLSSSANIVEVIFSENNQCTEIGKFAFYWCENLEKIVFPDNLKNIDDYAFSGCDKLNKIILPTTLISLGNETFSYCKNLEYIVLPKQLTFIGSGICYGNYKPIIFCQFSEDSIPEHEIDWNCYATLGNENLTYYLGEWGFNAETGEPEVKDVNSSFLF